MHTITFCKYRKKLLASPRVHLVLYIELLSRFRQTFSTSLSSVEINLELSYMISTTPIVFKFSLYIDIWVMHVRKKFGFEIRIASYKFMQFTVICK